MSTTARRLALICIMLITAVITTTRASPASAASRTFSVSDCATVTNPGKGTGCGPALVQAMRQLVAGDTLLIAPGSYDVDSFNSTLLGTATNRITIAAQDPNNRPLIRGWTLFVESEYMTLSGIDFQATVPTKGALQFLCGVGWTVENSHIFGAMQTKAFYNLMISGRQVGPPNADDGTECATGPKDFMIRNNAFTNPYTEAGLNTSTVPGERTRGTEYHNIYAAFEGNNNTGGTIEHNLFVGNLNGAGVKLQDGKFQTIGPWHVKINYNTFFSGQRGIYLLNDVRYNTMVGNLIDRMAGGGGTSGLQVGVALYAVTNTTNSLSHTYASNLTRVWATVKPDGSTLIDGGDNVIRSDPRYVTYGLLPGLTAAKTYGAYSPNSFS